MKEIWAVLIAFLLVNWIVMTVIAEIWRQRCYRARAERDYWMDYFFRNDELPKEVRK